MNLYHVEFDGDSDFVEARSLREAIDIWRAEMVEREDHDWDPNTDPDSVHHVHDEPVMRAKEAS